MTNFVQKGITVTLAAPYNVTSGGGLLVGTIFGIASDTALSTASVEAVTEGVFDITKAAGVVVQGQKMFWDDSAKVVTTVTAGNFPIGSATQAQLTGDTTARVRLNPHSTSKPFKSTEQTGTGSAQNVAHGFGVVPSLVIFYPSDTSPATIGVYTLTEGTHTSTNVVVTVTTGKKFFVVAWA